MWGSHNRYKIVRKHISKIQGGKLALQSKAPVCALIISDVVGDNPSDIASGPCSADPSTFQDAIDVLSRWQVNVPPKIGKYLEKGKRREIEDNPKPGDTRLRHVSEAVIATAKTSLNAVKKYAEAQGISCISMGDAITGEAKMSEKLLVVGRFQLLHLIVRILKNHYLYYREANAL